MTASRWVNASHAHSLTAEHGVRAAAFIDTIDQRIEHVCTRFELEPGETLQGGVLGVVVAATNRDGAEVVVKLSPDETDLARAAATHAWWAASTTAITCDVLDSGPGYIVFERVQPGTPLRDHDTYTPTEAHAVAIELLEHVNNITAAVPDSLAEWREALGWRQRHAVARIAAALRDPQNEALLGELNILYNAVVSVDLDELDAALRHERVVVCHGDLWGNNIIASARGIEWALIDPMPYVGPVVCDAVFHAVCASWGTGAAELCSTHPANTAAVAALGKLWSADRAAVAVHHGFEPDARIPKLARAALDFAQL